MSTTTPLLIDASSLRWAHCLRRFYLQNICGYTFGKTPDMEFGSMFHKYADLRTKFPRVSKEPDAEHVADADTYLANAVHPEKAKLFEACMQFDNFDFSGETVYSELRFKIKCPFDVGEIYLCGTIDRIIVCDSGLGVIDYKTTRKYHKDEFFGDFWLDTQMIFYYWMLAKFSEHIVNSELAKLCANKKHFCQVLGIFISRKPISLELSPVYTYNDDLLCAFGNMLSELINGSIYYLTNREEVPLPYGMLNNTCRGCPFIPYCKNDMQGIEQVTTKSYDPMTHGL